MVIPPFSPFLIPSPVPLETTIMSDEQAPEVTEGAQQAADRGYVESKLHACLLLLRAK
jgi:hypothetical protein